MSPKPRKKNTRRKVYSTGQLNRIVDTALHPLYKKTELIRIIDGLVHAAIEQNPRKSAKKFLIYNARDILKEIIDKL